MRGSSTVCSGISVQICSNKTCRREMWVSEVSLCWSHTVTRVFLVTSVLFFPQNGGDENRSGPDKYLQ